MTVLPSDLDIQVALMRQAMSDLHTCMPGEIVGVREGKDARQFVDVLPTIQRAVIDEAGVQIDEAYPVIPMVPVGYMQGGGFFVSLPLKVGDIVLIVFAERSLDAWIETAKLGGKSPVVPGDLSMHTLQGAIALPCGPAPRASLLTGVDAADLVIGTTSGTVLQRWKSDGSVWLAEGEQFVALANLVATELERIQGDIDTLKSATSNGIKAVGESTAASGSLGQAAFDLAAGSVPSSPASVAATKTKAT